MRLQRRLRPVAALADFARARPRAPKPLTNSSSLSGSVRDSVLGLGGRQAQRLDDAARLLERRLQERHAAALVLAHAR